MLELIQKGGITMYPILFLSIIALAVFLERLISLRKEKFVPQQTYHELVVALNKKDLQKALNICKTDGSSLSNVSKAIIENIDLPLTRLLGVAEESGRNEVKKLDRFQATLDIVSGIAPLLGLLGTVFGMIKIFNVIAAQGGAGGNAEALSAGIAEALITTAAGLSVAIPAQFFNYIIKAKADSIATDLEIKSSEVINAIFKEGHFEVPQAADASKE